MATVKGDVHDIGKNIVGVVLGCNDYEVIDLGVMVPCEKILQTAREQQVDMIGLSGLITPSLDEMVHVATEMEREGFDAAAADRRRDDQRQAHGGQDRAGVSRAGHPRQGRLALRRRRRSAEPARAAKPSSTARTAPSRRRSAKRSPSAAQRKLVPYAEALRTALRHRLGTPPNRRAGVPGHADARATSRWPRSCPYIDWSPFFMTWELKGKYPAIFDDPDVGAEARELFDDAQQLLRADRRARSCSTAHAVYGFFPANADGDDIVVYTDEIAHARSGCASPCCASSGSARARRRSAAWPTTSPRSASGVADYLGAFAVTAGRRASRSWSQQFKADHDDYNAIMVKALADRLAEAFAELLHERARRDWGYGRDEGLSQGRPDRGEVPRHPPGRRLSRPAPTTPRRRRSGACSTSRAPPASA